MTKEERQKEKELLLKYLSARLPYGGKSICTPWIDGEYVDGITRFEANLQGTWVNIGNVRPYLRPMSSMTEEEETTYRNTWCDPLFDLATKQHSREEELMILAKAHHDSIVFLLENHFDFLGLIPLGLAIEVTEENNPYKE